jgi:tetracycline resistance efflux pump
MQNSLITLLPPLIVIAAAFLTQRIILSLFIGIISGTLIANDFALIPAIKSTLTTIWNTTEIGNVNSLKTFFESNNIILFLFLLVLGIIISLLTYSGSANAYRNFIEKKVKTKKGVSISSLILSKFFFLDDHFSCVTVGSVMHPLADKFKMAKVKTAYLVNTLAPTLAIIVPISSWCAAIVLNIENSGVSDILKDKPTIFADPFYLYLSVIPFIFYSFITIISTWFITLNNISFGQMKTHEKIAEVKENLFGGKNPIKQRLKVNKNSSSSLIDFLLPLILLISSIAFLILYTGNYHLFGGTNNFIIALQKGSPITSLFLGSLFTLIFTTTMYLIKNKIRIKDLGPVAWDGINLLAPSLILLILAWSLTDVLNNQLLTGRYLAELFVQYANIELLPFLFYFVTMFTAIAIASAWGAMAIMIPIGIQMLASFVNMPTPIDINTIPMIYPLLGAILSGAVSANHISPTSDTVVMTSRSTGAYHIDHVKTLHTYTIPAVISTAISFLLAGILIKNFGIKLSLLISFSTGILLNFGILTIRNRFNK